MTAYLTLRNLFDLFCIVQGITTAVWLLLQPKRPANRWLALLLAGLTCQVIDYFLSRSGIYYRNRWLYFTPLFFSWGFGPFVYGYVQARTTKTGHLSGWHFLPLAVQVLFYGLLVFQPLDTKTWFWLAVHKPFTRYVEYYIGCLLMLYYLYQSWRLVHHAAFSVGWLKPALQATGLFYGLALIDPLVNFLYLTPQDTKFFLTTQLLPVLAYAAALGGRIYSQDLDQAKEVPPLPIKEEQQEQIRNAMENQKLYQDPELTLASLAAQVGLSPNLVSRIINTRFGQSFTDYINTYRVEEVKRRLDSADAERLTILALALEAGFSSKTTFNRVFKEQTGSTPKEYQKRSQTMIRDDTDA